MRRLITVGCDGATYPRVKKLVLGEFGEEAIREFKAKQAPEEDELLAREAADWPKVFGIVAAAFRSLVTEVGTDLSSASKTKIHHLTLDKAVTILASRKDLTWNGAWVYDSAGTMAKTFKQSLPPTKKPAKSNGGASAAPPVGSISLRPGGKWSAWLKLGKNQHFVGLYDTQEQAATALAQAKSAALG